MSVFTHHQPKPPGDSDNDRISYEEYLACGDDVEGATEWVNGKVVAMAPVSDAHNDLTGFLISILTEFVKLHDSGKVRHEPFQMKTAPDLPGRSPDVMVIRKQNLTRIQNTFLEGPADLVVEIISPNSRARDRGEKFYEYEQGGVPEYWLIDPDRKQAEFYQRGTDGIFRSVAPGADRVYRSSAIGDLWIQVDWLWTSPATSDVVKAWYIA